MNILSLFDGISIAKVSLEKLNIPITNYFSSEIDKYAIKVSQDNHKDIIRLGDIRYIKNIKVPIDLMIGGFCCQSFSISGKGLGFNDPRGQLFYEAVRLINTLKPKYFILENVNSMKKADKDHISKILGVEPVMIDASLVSAQSRKRVFWVAKLNEQGNYEQVYIPQPKDLGIMLKDVLEKEVDEKYYINLSEKYGLKGLCLENGKAKCMTASMYKGYGNDSCSIIKVGEFNSGGQGNRIYSPEGKSTTLMGLSGGDGGKTGLYAVAQRGRPSENGKNEQQIEFGQKNKSNCLTTVQKDSMIGLVDAEEVRVRRLTPIECERLMGLDDGYTKSVSDTQRYKCLGNGFHVDVIRHIIFNIILEYLRG